MTINVRTSSADLLVGLGVVGRIVGSVASPTYPLPTLGKGV